ncbi:hypothetical protein ABZ419_22950 [Streptomyces cinnamoneus]
MRRLLRFAITGVLLGLVVAGCPAAHDGGGPATPQPTTRVPHLP